MKGTMVILRPGTLVPDVRDFNRPLTLEDVQGVIGGYFEVVPRFDTLGIGDAVVHCVALCNENGKLDHLAINDSATVAWERALRRNGTLSFRELLVGNVAVLFGDREFMEAL